MSESGISYFKPDEEKIDNLIDIIKSSYIIGCEVKEYTTHEIKEDGTIDYNRMIYTGHRRITFHIQERFKERGIVRLSGQAISRESQKHINAWHERKLKNKRD